MNALSTAGRFRPPTRQPFRAARWQACCRRCSSRGAAARTCRSRSSRRPAASSAATTPIQAGFQFDETFSNDLSDDSFASNYRRVYGNSDPGGSAQVGGEEDHSGHGFGPTAFDIDKRIILAAPLLHDWGKPIVFQWNADGTEYAEFNFGGNGATDNYGAAGDSRTGAHHIIGVAESMSRGLQPKFVITQASAHSNPTSGNEYKVVNWLRSAAIIRGDQSRGEGLPARRWHRQPASAGRAAPGRGRSKRRLATQANAPVEYELHNLSDADFTQTGPSVSVAQILLGTLAPEFGFSPSDTTNYNLHYRKPRALQPQRRALLYSSTRTADWPPSAPTDQAARQGNHLDIASNGDAGPLGGPELFRPARFDGDVGRAARRRVERRPHLPQQGGGVERLGRTLIPSSARNAPAGRRH